MNDKDKMKYIEEAVKTFKECLEKTYLGKDNQKRDFYGMGYNTLTSFFTGKVSHHRKDNGNLRMSGELPKVMLDKSCIGLPRNIDDWRIFPLVIRLFHYNPDDKDSTLLVKGRQEVEE